MLKLRSPAALMLIAAHLCAAAVLFCLWSAAQFPDPGLRFQAPDAAGQVRVSDAEGRTLATLAADDIITFRTNDDRLTRPAGELYPAYIHPGTAAALADWYSEHTVLANRLRSGGLSLQLPAASGGQTFDLVSRQKGLSGQSLEFWILISGGALVFLVGSWVWALRPRDWGAATYGLSAIGLAAAAWSAALYAAREFAVDGGFLWGLTIINYLGSQLSFWAVAAMFMNFPRPLIRPRLWHLAIPVLIVSGAAAGTAYLEIKLVFRSLFLVFLILAGLIAAQAWKSRGDPVARAVLSWMGLTVLLGTSIGVAILVLPRLTGGPQAVSNAVVIIPMLLAYGGVAVGVGRYRLFDLDRWAYRLIAAAAAAMALLIVDAALIAVLQLQPPAALSIAAVVVALAYMPLRSALWRLMAGKVTVIDSRLFQKAAEVAFTPDAHERQEAWRAMLLDVFDALEIEAGPDGGRGAILRADGLELVIPPSAGAGTLLLRYPGKGRRLFNADHVALARELIAFMDKAETARDAYRKGVMEERGRIAQDLHDDVGARLLTSLHRPQVDLVRADVREAMSDIRAIVAGLTGEEVRLPAMVGELRREACARLEEAGLAVDWPMPAVAWPDRPLDHALYRNLRSAFREVVSNVLRHAGASRVEGRAWIDEAGDLRLTLRDDGVGLKPAAPGERQGAGLGNLRRRLAQIGGRIDLTPADPGLRVEIAVRLD